MMFSIVTVCRNSAKTIQETMRSVLSQNFSDFEYIIQDGQSTDGTLDIVRSLNSDKIQLFVENDQGISDGFNRGLAKASGKYILLLSSDDVLHHDNVLQTVANFLKSQTQKIEVVHGDTVHLYEDPYVSHGTDDLRLLTRGMIINHSTCFVHRSLYQKFGAFKKDYRFAMDYDLILRFYLGGARFAYLPETLTRIQMEGASSLNIVKALREGRCIQIQNGISAKKAWFYYFRSIIRMKAREIITKLGFNNFVKFYRRNFSINKKTQYRY